MSDITTTTYAITRPWGEGARVVSHPRLLVTDVPDDVTERELLHWLDDYDPLFDSAMSEDEWTPGVQLAAADVPSVRWRGRPGRPEIGPAVTIRLDPHLLAAVDAEAERSGESRAAMIRMLLGEAFLARLAADAVDRRG
ncbi:MAG: ribbon-helix-helix domain-containing protein [Gemmatimonadaceae bacterium]|nr:ribbon-helix-helix domain-containing protein [Gemmatimonadaceae bacterium]